MAQDIKEILKEYKKHTDDKFEEIKRHFDIIKEDTDSKIKLLAEG
jgi:hypothetical protein